MTDQIKILRVESCASTNSFAASLPMPEANQAPTAVVADNQTAGRGQKGNCWEAEPGKNLTFSILWRPAGILPAEQFAISEAVALAVCDLLGKNGIEALVKWPNDIYVADMKICGILIEHSLLGNEISRTIAGVGINVNQTEFLSDAPNPVSMAQLTGKVHDLQELISGYCQLLTARIRLIGSEDGRKEMHEEYKRRMWRNDRRFHPFRDARLGIRYYGRIEDVEPQGFLRVSRRGDETQFRYAFKEVEFLLSGGF